MREISSFRDDSGFVFSKKGFIYRRVNNRYKQDYDHLMVSGLYNKLISKSLLVSHEEQKLDDFDKDEHTYKIIKPQQLKFISYPYSWSFSMLKDAAMLTLNVQKIALEYGMILKDASLYNVQFIGSHPIFIDTLSFECFQEGVPWTAYRQYCQHFLAPLALMSYTDISLSKLLVSHLDGIPLPLAAKLLPTKSRLKIGLNIHLFLHAKMAIKYNDRKVAGINKRFTSSYFKNLAENLIDTTKKLKWAPVGTEWAEYYDKSVGDAYFKEKQSIIKVFFSKINAETVLDLGANDGTFSQLAKEYCKTVFSFDVDPACVETNYLKLKKANDFKTFPLILDITNPEPGIGWLNLERKSILERIDVDTVMLLAVIHHLCISNNLPMEYLASFFAQLTKKSLIIEFVPKTDEKVQILLRNKVDVFSGYNIENFITVFSKYFIIREQKQILPTERVLLLLEKKLDD